MRLYDNNLASSKIGIYLCNTTSNKIYNNSMQDSEHGMMVKANMTEKIVQDNTLLNTIKDFFRYPCVPNNKAI